MVCLFTSYLYYRHNRMHQFKIVIYEVKKEHLIWRQHLLVRPSVNSTKPFSD